MWASDLREIGFQDADGQFDVVPGLPNSRATGIQRGSGIVHGRMACKLRGLPSIRRLWDAACVATGRPAVFQSGAAVVPPDGVLFTKASHRFQGLDRHRDWEVQSCGLLQGLMYVYPPPDGTLRLGAAFSACRAHPELLERVQSLALSGWSSSPEVDWRTSPAPALGSPATPDHGWAVVGGPVLAKGVAMGLSAEARRRALAKLPQRVQDLIHALAAFPPRCAKWIGRSADGRRGGGG